MARFLKYGISTGASAAAAAKAAVLAMTNAKVDKVVIPTPIGIRFEIPVKSVQKFSDINATATVVKDAGEDIDVTNGMDIIATVTLTEDGMIYNYQRQGCRQSHKAWFAGSSWRICY